MHSKRVIFIGDTDHGEFREAVAWLREYCDLAAFDNVPAAVSHFQRQRKFPDAIVVAMARPDVITQRQIEVLHGYAPLARLIVLLGGWCDGETRTGRPLRGVVRVCSHQFIARFASELENAQPTKTLAHPRTLTDVERLMNHISMPVVEQSGLLVIKTDSVVSYQGLSDCCEELGLSAVWSPMRQRSFASAAALGIWECRESIATNRSELRSFVDDIHPAPVIVVAGFPRESDRLEALTCGASALVAKPFLIQELWSEITRVISAPTLVGLQKAVA